MLNMKSKHPVSTNEEINATSKIWCVYIHRGSQANPTIWSGSVVDCSTQTMHLDSPKQSTANGGFVY